MGFPNNYILNNNTGEQYKQIGNSVAVPVIQAIAESLIEQGLLTKSNKDNGDGRGYIQSEQLKIDF
jgi:DNA (cytosine-5)-methyltransferase 1